jgi:transcriptional regulator with XRE-family HTH domain
MSFVTGSPATRIALRSGLKAMREKKGLTQRRLAHDLGISQNYIPAIDAGACRAGPKLQEQLVKYFGCDFADPFEVVLVDGETGREQVLGPAVRPRS